MQIVCKQWTDENYWIIDFEQVLFRLEAHSYQQVNLTITWLVFVCMKLVLRLYQILRDVSHVQGQNKCPV